MKAAATTSRQHGEARHHGRLGLLGRPLIRRHRRRWGTQTCTLGAVPAVVLTATIQVVL